MNFLDRPTVQLKLKYLTRPIGIVDWMRELNIKFYAYSFYTVQGEVLKYGASGDCHTGEPGERMYRQAGHIPGWDQAQPWLVGSSGDDMLQILNDYTQTYKKSLFKDDVMIDVWPMNMVALKNVKKACEEVERELITEHIAKYGMPPIGNKDHQTNRDLRIYLNEKILSGFVEFV
jgi:hypothetical protein